MMLRSVLALAVCAVLAASSPAWAQSGVGVMAGVNFSKITFPDAADVPKPDTRVGFVGGLFVTMPLAERVGLEMDILYSQKGAEISESGAKATIALDYLDVPVLARMAATTGKNHLAIMVGPSFGFKLRAHSKAEFQGQSEEVDIGSDVSSFDLGLVVGAGVESGKFSVDGRYQWGLSNANKDEFDVTDVKNRVFSILFGLRF